MWISLKKPYKIISNKEKQYQDHYQIPASKCLVVALKRRDEEMLCDVHWREDDGLHATYNIMFNSENLEPVDTVGHPQLFELWERVYNPGDRTVKAWSLPPIFGITL